MKTALGFRVHSGWAAMVVVAGTPVKPAILDRRRIEIMDPRTPGAKQPFHHAAELDLVNAQRHLDKCAAQSRKLAIAAVESAVAKHKPVACGIGIASGRPLGSLESTLASHAAIHTAEGEFFREAILRAIESCELPCHRFKEKELLSTAARVFSIPDPDRELTAMRKVFGPPWTQDEKFAALAAWLAMI
jgi:hypothetical protein